LYQLFERGFDAMLGAYKRGLHVVLDHQFITLMTFIATVAATGVLFVFIPKGFFPQQDTGFISGFAESAQDASFASMNARMLELADVVRKDPDVTGFGMNGSSSTYNTGNFFISLKPKDEGRTASADEIITRLRPQLAKVQG
ncbi:acriflavine resistance protein B, partial [Mycobacterium tuberculosis]